MYASYMIHAMYFHSLEMNLCKNTWEKEDNKLAKYWYYFKLHVLRVILVIRCVLHRSLYYASEILIYIDLHLIQTSIINQSTAYIT